MFVHVYYGSFHANLVICHFKGMKGTAEGNLRHAMPAGCQNPHLGFGLLLVFVVVELLPSQDEPAAVPGLDETPLLPEPPTSDDAWPRVPLALRVPAPLGTAVGHTLVVHYSRSILQQKEGQRRVQICRSFLEVKGSRGIQNSSLLPVKVSAIIYPTADCVTKIGRV